MPDETATQQTANAEDLAASAPATAQQLELTDLAVNQDSAPETEVKSESAASEPAKQEEPKVVQEVKHLRKRAQSAEQEAAYWRGQAEAKAQSPQPVQAEDVPTQEKYDDYGEYLVEKSKYGMRKELAVELANLREQERLTAIETNYQKRLFELSNKNPEISSKITQNQMILPKNQQVVLAIKESEMGPEIAGYLAENPAEAIRISQIPITAAIREIGKIEAKLSMPKEQIQTKKVSLAPEPIKPIAGSSQVSKSLDEMSIDEFIRARNAKQVGR